MKKAGLVCCLVFWLSCSLDYQEGQLEDSLSEKIPDSILYGFQYNQMEKGQPSFIVTADKAEVFNSSQLIKLYEVQFEERDSQGMVQSEGKSRFILMYSDSHNAELRGDILLYSHKQEAEINCSELFWNDEKKELYADQHIPVSLSKKKGSQLKGKGFKIDVRKNQLDFSSGAEGVYKDAQD